MSASPAPLVRNLLIGGPLVLAFAFALVSASELSITWLGMILGGLAFAIPAFLSGRPEMVMFSCYIATVSVEITKGLVAEGGVYTPGLYLSLSDLFLLPLLFFRIATHLLTQSKADRLHPLLLAATVWLLWQWLVSFSSPVQLGGFLVAVNQTKYLLAMWLVADYLREPAHWRQLMYAVGISIGLHFVMSMLQVVSAGALQLQGIKASTQQTVSYAGAGLIGLFRPSGLLSHPNALADYLALVLPVAMGLLMLGKRACGHAFLSMAWALVAGLLMLILTLSRGGWIAFAVGVLCFLALGYRRGMVSALHLKRVVIVSLLGVMVTLVAFPAAYLRITESDNRSTRSRFLLAEQAVLIIEHNPFAGVGLGAYTYASNRITPTSFSSIEPEFHKILLKEIVHNKYLLVGAETGLLGLLLFLNVFRIALSSLWRIRFTHDPPRQALALGLFAGIVASMATFMVEPANIGVSVETVWVALGAIVALTRGRLQPVSVNSRALRP